ncbi:hypothetical protein C3B51_11835 [Pseudoalteromonas rubra]|uniref:KAP NTPase domain-containing protein n=1 Tax=Pseudoalteromonas rubra TaxID=43658 RepID=A0A4Q7EBC4_9GAMM|nr:P-loop NTPase fold protein [Pseudoalteromonas rubra]RZM80749.1 hypothetical protein C3B51_11835 [Pseudoalteromonas rubra]
METAVDLERRQAHSKTDNRLLEALQNAYQLDEILPALIAARCALRVFPLLGSRFNDWPWRTLSKQASSSQDPNLNSLFSLALFHVCQSILRYSVLSPVSRSLSELKSASEYIIEPEYFFADKGDRMTQMAAEVAKAIKLLSELSTLHKDTEVIELSRASIERAHEATSFYGERLTEYMHQSLEKDFEHISRPDTLATLPLWHDDIPPPVQYILGGSVKHVKGKLPGAGKRTKDSISDIFSDLYSQYEACLKGFTLPYQTVSAVSPELANLNEDYLQRAHLVDGLGSLLQDKSNKEHLTIGLLGHWGAGKSRVIALLKDKLSRQDRNREFLFGEFNAWAYEHVENPQAAMAHEVIKALTQCQRLRPTNDSQSCFERFKLSVSNALFSLGWACLIRVRLTLGFVCQKFPGRLTFLLLLIAIPIFFNCYLQLIEGKTWGSWVSTHENDMSLQFITGAYFLFLVWRVWKDLKKFLAQPYTKELLTYLKLPDYAKEIGQVAEMREDIGILAGIRLGYHGENNPQWLGKVLPKRRFLFVVDDLDRCGPEGIVKTFEAIRLVLDLPQVYVVVAVDQRIAMAALALHYEKLQPHHTLKSAKAIARDYLAKMIQLPIMVNDADKSALQGYVNHLWQEEQQDWSKYLPTLADSERNTPNIIADDSVKSSVELTNSGGNSAGQGSDDRFVEDGLARIKRFVKQPFFHQQKDKLGLSGQQKAAFYYWACEFGINNARQVKRLYNSYNLIGLVSKEKPDWVVDTESDVDTDTKPSKPTNLQFVYLVTLMALEFINSSEDNLIRCAYSKLFLEGVSSDVLKQANRHHVELLQQVRMILDEATKGSENRVHEFNELLQFVERFVLPAIDGFELDDEKNSAEPP